MKIYIHNKCKSFNCLLPPSLCHLFHQCCSRLRLWNIVFWKPWAGNVNPHGKVGIICTRIKKTKYKMLDTIEYYFTRYIMNKKLHEGCEEDKRKLEGFTCRCANIYMWTWLRWYIWMHTRPGSEKRQVRVCACKCNWAQCNKQSFHIQWYLSFRWSIICPKTIGEIPNRWKTEAIISIWINVKPINLSKTFQSTYKKPHIL